MNFPPKEININSKIIEITNEISENHSLCKVLTHFLQFDEDIAFSDKIALAEILTERLNSVKNKIISLHDDLNI